MNAWIQFIGTVPPRSGNFGFKINGRVINNWVDNCKPNKWYFISIVSPVVPGGDANWVLYIFDSVKSP